MPGAVVSQQKLSELPQEIVDFHSQRSVPTGAEKGLQHLQDKHREVIRLHVNGYRSAEIAQITGFSKQHIYLIMASPIAQSYALQLRVKRDETVMKVRDKLLEKAEEMVEELGWIATNRNSVPPAERLKAIDSALDRAGFGRTSRVESVAAESKHTTIEHIHKLAAELGTSKYAPPIEVVLAEPSKPVEPEEGPDGSQS